MAGQLLSGAAVALAAISLLMGCGATHRKAATLGVPWGPYQTGYGEIAPRAIFNGGDPTGRADHLRWHGWGSAKAVGTGLGWDIRGRVRIQLIATNLGPCHGHPAYRRISFWFPTLTPHQGARYNICPSR
jgi:hypothetical protein